MFLKGFLIGLIIFLANFAVSNMILRSQLKKRPDTGASNVAGIVIYLISFFLRFAIIGVLVYLFLKLGWGSVPGLMIGFTAALVIFTIWKVNSGNPRSNKL